jgi:hypothetical protein
MPGGDSANSSRTWTDSPNEARYCSFAEPLEPDDEHEVIRRVDQERDESLVMLAEMQRAQ